jgi:hypothetical protein
MVFYTNYMKIHIALQEKLPFPTVKLWRVGHNRRRFSFLPAVEKPPPLASSHRRL